MYLTKWFLLLSMFILFCACAEEGDGSDTDGKDEVPTSEQTGTDDETGDDNTIVGPSQADLDLLPTEEAEQYQLLKAEYDSSLDMTAAAFSEKYAVPFTTDLDFDPLNANNLTLIQESSLALSEEGLNALSANGFVIVEDFAAPSFFNAYEKIYHEDLPVYISADSILDAVHRSYDAILKDVEDKILFDALEGMLTGMRANLASLQAGVVDETVLADVDFFLAVALSLLEQEAQAPVKGADPEVISQFLQLADAAEGEEMVSLFGVDRQIDFSQFIPRGHYEGNWRLEPYFKSMMWLGRIDFRLVETDSEGNRNLNRNQVEAVLAMEQLMTQSERDAWSQMNTIVEKFVGKSDNMTIVELSALKGDLGIADLNGFAALEDEFVKQTILKNGYGTQEICSHLMVHDPTFKGTLPLNASFLLFGQRYVIDSHVFSNVVYDRVQQGTVKRMMPDPLDAAFAAFGNDQAASLLTEEIKNYGYAPDLHMTRTFVDAHPDDFWGESLYNLWLGALRTLSPGEEVANPAAAGISTVFGTEKWGRRLLNTQLGSWAELRHDNLLYAKQSYTDMPACEYPDAYVDPYPAFFGAVEAFAQTGHDIADLVDLSGESYYSEAIRAYFDQLEATATILKEMAEKQRLGEPFTEEQLAFVNDAVAVRDVDVVCATMPGPAGWYSKLFFDAENLPPFERDPVIADVHTQPADEAGNIVGKVLHVAVGEPRMMVTTVNTCDGPRAYVGPVFSYFEKVTDNFDRMTDSAWSAELTTTPQTDVPWMAPVIAP